jgi:hypothetical protein
MLNLSRGTGLGQGAKLSVLNSQWMNTFQAKKVESRGKVTIQSARGGKLALSRGPERHKGWEQGSDNKPNSQIGASGGSHSWSHGTEGSIQNWISPPCWGRSWPNKVAVKGQWCCHLVKTTVLATLQKQANSCHLPICKEPCWQQEFT